MNKEKLTTQTLGFVDTADASRLLGVKLSTIYSYSHLGILPRYKPRGGKLLFKISDLEQLILDGKIED